MADLRGERRWLFTSARPNNLETEIREPIELTICWQHWSEFPCIFLFSGLLLSVPAPVIFPVLGLSLFAKPWCCRLFPRYISVFHRDLQYVCSALHGGD